MQTDLYLIRHGETATNRAYMVQGANSEPLNVRGRWQAAQVGSRLARAGLQALYASPFGRTRETAAIIGRAVGLDAVLEHELREMDTGRASGLHGAQFIVRYPRLWWAWLRDDDRLAFPEGEILAEFYPRARRVIDALVAAHAGQTIAVVTHGGIISGYLSQLLHGRGSNRIAWRLRNCAICHVRWEDDGPPLLVAFNDTTHLREPFPGTDRPSSE
jgi:2,3-bisphosphoglycerate-dependent phosphoglycerate mutase